MVLLKSTARTPCAKTKGKLYSKGSSPRKTPFELTIFAVYWQTRFSLPKGPVTAPIDLKAAISEKYKIGESFRNVGEKTKNEKKRKKNEEIVKDEET